MPHLTTLSVLGRCPAGRPWLSRLVLPVLGLLCAPAQAVDLSALTSRGWTFTPPDRSGNAQLQWHGSGPQDQISAILGKPTASTLTPGQWLDAQMPAVKRIPGVGPCTSTVSKPQLAIATCPSQDQKSVYAIIVTQVNAGTRRMLTAKMGANAASKNEFLGATGPLALLTASSETLEGVAPQAQAPRAPTPSARAPSAGAVAAAAPAAAPSAGDGGGGQIEGVYHHPDWRYMFNMGSRDFGSDYILFKNGDAWRDPKLPPEAINVARDKAAYAKDWGRWRRAGDSFFVKMPDMQKEEESQMIPYGPAQRGEQVEGSWHAGMSSVSTAGGQTTTGAVGNILTLHRNGRFERSGYAGASFANSGAAGTYQKSSGMGSGTYRIEGFMLEMSYADGRVERDLFYWAGGKNKYDMVMLNGTQYLGGLAP